MLSADRTIWEEAINGTDDFQPFISKQMVWTQDQNNNGYSGEIQFDMSSLANSQAWLDYQNAYLVVPYIVSLKGDGTHDYSAAVNAYTLGLKNGYYQIIDSLEIQLNNTTICASQSHLNMLVNYNVMTKFSQDDLNKLGPVLGINPDTADSYTFSGTGAHGNGDGYCNNINANNISATGAFLTYNDRNSGFLNRQRFTTANAITGVSHYVPTSSTSAEKKSIFSLEGRNYLDISGSGAARIYSFVINAVIRLKDLSNYFENAPISRGCAYRLNIKYSSCQTQITVGARTFVTTAHVQLSGRSQPVMLASCLTDSSNAAMGGISGVLDFASGVTKNSINTSNGISSISAARIYVPSYKLDPIYEGNLLAKATTTVKYLDYYNYEVKNIDGGSSFNAILTNGIVRPKLLLIIPFVTPVTDLVNAKSLEQYQMIYDSAPGTSAPEASIINLQVQLSGENVFMSTEAYTFQNFLDEFQSANGLNGGLTDSINNGLISHYMWVNAYRYYVVNLSRRQRYEDKVPKSVLISGVNNCKVAISYQCFILYEKEIVLKTSTGEIVG